MRKKNINETLNRNLFLFPNPVEHRVEIFKLYPYIFYNIEDFKLFLTENNYDNKVTLAKKILLRLCFESNFPPPTKLLFNILDFEIEISPHTKDGFISKDHFVHLVNLYLLGLYLFMYHSNIHSKIMSNFKNQRRNIKYKNNLIYNSIKDFIKAWRYFVVFHDLGYPIEFYLGLSRNNQNQEFNIRKNNQLNIFNKIKQYLIKDIALKSLSELIVFNQIILNNQNHLLNELVISFFDINDRFIEISDNLINSTNNYNIEEILIDRNEYYLIENIYGSSSLRIFSSINKWDNIISVLIKKGTDEPLIIIKHDCDDKKSIIYKTPYFKNNCYKAYSILNEAKKSVVNNNNYYWNYFSKKNNENLNLLSNNTKINYSELESINAYFNSKTSQRISHINNEQDFKNYCFDIYLILYSLLGMMDESDYDLSSYQVYYDAKKPIVNSLKNDLPFEVAKIFNKLFSDYFKSFKLEQINNLDVSEIVEKTIKEIAKKDNSNISIKSFISKIVSNLNKDVKDKINNQISLITIWKGIRKEIESLPNEAEELNFNSEILTNDENFKLFNYSSIYDDDILKDVFLNNEICSINDFTFNNYIPKHIKESNKEYIIDHGLISAFIFYYSNKLYNEYFEKDSGELLKLGLGIENTQDDNLKLEQNVLLKKVFYSILIHNIYPKYLINNKKNFKTSIEKSPFTYLAILSDSLQPWDRKRNFNPAFINSPYNVSGDRFNIEVTKDGKKIIIEEEGFGMDMEKKINELSSFLDEFLESASNLFLKKFQDYYDI